MGCMVEKSRVYTMKTCRYLLGIVLLLFLLLSVPANAQNTIIRDFTANVTSGTPPLSVLFTDISTIPVIENFRRWDFGDGTVVMDPEGTVIHTYLQEGSFTVRLDRTDSEGYHSLIKYAYITVVLPTPTPTTTPTTPPTTSPTPTTIIPTTSTTMPTTVPTTQPTVQIPSEFYGQATFSTLPVPAGSSIIAKIGARNAGAILVTVPGSYGGPGPFDQRLKVYATNDEIGGGTVTITFWLNGTVQAGQTAYFQSGSGQNLPLVFGSLTPTPTTTPTTIPTTSPATTVTTVIPTTSPATTVTTVIPTTTVPTITPTGTPGVTLSFEPGWNHVSIPRILASGANTGTIFSPINTAGHSIWRYNSTIQLYERVYPGTYLNPIEGIWIYSSYRTTLPLYFAGEQGLIERDLITGWNGFGIPNLTDISARDAFSPVYSSWRNCYGFDAINQRYDVSIIKDGSGIHKDTRPLNPGSGYWLYMMENATFRTFIPDL